MKMTKKWNYHDILKKFLTHHLGIEKRIQHSASSFEDIPAGRYIAEQYKKRAYFYALNQ